MINWIWKSRRWISDSTNDRCWATRKSELGGQQLLREAYEASSRRYPDIRYPAESIQCLKNSTLFHVHRIALRPFVMMPEFPRGLGNMEWRRPKQGHGPEAVPHKIEKMSSIDPIAEWGMAEERDSIWVGWTFLICCVTPPSLHVRVVQPDAFQQPGAFVSKWKNLFPSQSSWFFSEFVRV